MKQFVLFAALLTLCFPLQATGQAISIPLEFTFEGDVSNIVIGTHPDASDNFDLDLDELAPPTPPFAGLHTWSTFNNENFSQDYRDTTAVEKIFHLRYEGHTGNNIVLSWDAAALAGKGIFEITDDITGLDFGPFDMTTAGSLDLSTGQGMLNEGLRIRVLLQEPGSGVSNEIAGDLPQGFSLEENFPNPFSRHTEIQFETTAAQHISLVVYDVLGQEISVLMDQVLPQGRHAARWDANQLPDGLYFYRLSVGGQSKTRSMTIIR